MKRYVSVLRIIYLCLAMAAVAAAQNQANPTTESSQASVPRLVRFSGTVKDDAGNPTSGMVGITFALYKDQEGGAELWLETQNVHLDSKGNYTVLLGSTTAEGLPTDIFSTNDARWLGVQVEGQKEHPRTLLVSAPYALKALDAETIGGKPASAFQLATPASKSGNGSAAAEQANEIICASGVACKAASIPVFASNGGSAALTASIIAQSGPNINVTGSINALGAQGNLFASNSIATGGSINANGTVAGNNINARGNLSANGTISGAAGKFSGIVSAANLTLNGVNGTVNAAIGNIGDLFSNAINVNSSTQAGVFSLSSVGSGVNGTSTQNQDFTAGVFGGQGGTAKTLGVFGFTTSSNGAGVHGRDVNLSATGQNFGPPSAGVWGDSGASAHTGVLATADDGNALFAFNNSGISSTIFARNRSAATGADVLVTLGSGLCLIDTVGNLSCGGSISGSVKNFKIDHPLDPANKYLMHASVESSEMMNIYTGNVVTDGSGEATVSLPEWFEALNTDFRYQLTVVGQFAQAIVAHKIADHYFQIKTSEPNVEVSWQVTGVRQDAYAKANPLVVEQEKEAKVKGFYIHPELYGAAADKQIAHGLFPEQMKRTTATAAKP